MSELPKVIGLCPIHADVSIALTRSYGERRNNATEDEMRDAQSVERTLIGNTDAQVWAREFVKMAEANPAIPTDEGTMLGWFASAIEAGRDAGRRSGDLDRVVAWLAERGMFIVISTPGRTVESWQLLDPRDEDDKPALADLATHYAAADA